MEIYYEKTTTLYCDYYTEMRFWMIMHIEIAWDIWEREGGYVRQSCDSYPLNLWLTLHLPMLATLPRLTMRQISDVKRTIRVPTALIEGREWSSTRTRRPKLKYKNGGRPRTNGRQKTIRLELTLRLNVNTISNKFLACHAMAHLSM